MAVHLLGMQEEVGFDSLHGLWRRGVVVAQRFRSPQAQVRFLPSPPPLGRKGYTMILTCFNCGKTFTRPDHAVRHAKNGHGRKHVFCSRPCYVKKWKECQHRYPPRLCEICGKPRQCGKRYCSGKCRGRATRLKHIEKVRKTGILYHGVCTSKVAVEMLTEIRGHQCAICMRRRWCGVPIPLVLDHIDGDASNWKLDNVRMICPNCDRQTPTFGSKNSGSGRHYRRIRYARGDSS